MALERARTTAARDWPGREESDARCVNTGTKKLHHWETDFTSCKRRHFATYRIIKDRATHDEEFAQDFESGEEERPTTNQKPFERLQNLFQFRSSKRNLKKRNYCETHVNILPRSFIKIEIIKEACYFSGCFILAFEEVV